MGIEKMKNRFIRHVLIWLLCGLCNTAAFAHGYDRNDPSKAWGYQPVVNTTISQPSYQFYSTSPYSSPISVAKANSYGMHSKPRKTAGFGDDPNEETDDEIGVVHPDREDLMPIGDTPWLFILLLAAGYMGFLYLRYYANSHELERNNSTFSKKIPNF